MKLIVTINSLVLLFFINTSNAGDPPQFFKETLPEHAITQIIQSWGAVQGKGAAIDPKTRELIAIAVAAQIPCKYCTYSHTKKAKRLGATDAEIREAIATAGYIRLWSTVLHGSDYDYDTFVSEIDKLMGGS